MHSWALWHACICELWPDGGCGCGSHKHLLRSSLGINVCAAQEGEDSTDSDDDPSSDDGAEALNYARPLKPVSSLKCAHSLIYVSCLRYARSLEPFLRLQPVPPAPGSMAGPQKYVHTSKGDAALAGEVHGTHWQILICLSLAVTSRLEQDFFLPLPQ